MRPRQLVIGLTGGIASGKSLVAAAFSKLAIAIIDADVIARELVVPGQAGYFKIVEHFGDGILQADGGIDRRALRELIFQNSSERRWLEDLLHPLIRQELTRGAAQAQSPYCILVIPLLTDRQTYPIINRVLLVDAPEHLQLRRVQARDQISLMQAKAILTAQSPREARLALADDIIINDGEVGHVQAQVLRLHERYLNEA